MRKFSTILMVGVFLLLGHVVQAQTTGSISGTVTDPNGAVVPGAIVTIKGAAGESRHAVPGAKRTRCRFALSTK